MTRRITQIRNPYVEHHPPNVKLYLGIFAGLLALTIITVLVSYWHLPPAPAIALGLAIAAVKASLVAAFFMHLKGERTLIFCCLGVTAVFLFILFALPITDSVAISEKRIAQPAEGEAGH